LPGEDQPQISNNTTNETTSEDDMFFNVTDIPESFNSTNAGEEWSNEIAFVRVAYMVIAAMIFISSILFVVLFFIMGPSCRDLSWKRTKKDKDNTFQSSKTQRTFTTKLLVFMFVYYFFYSWLENIPGSLIAVFTVKGLGWPNDHGALVTSAYWGALGVGRLLGIPMALAMSPQSMIILDMVIVAAGFGLLFFVQFHTIIMWVAACVFGLGMGSIFPSGILWAESYIEITGAASSVFLAASSTGGMVGPALTGYLMDEFTHMCFVYVLFSTSLLSIAIYTGAVIFANKSGVQRSKRKTLHVHDQNAEQEMKVLNSHRRPTQNCTSQEDTVKATLNSDNLESNSA
jgi:fucose permease